MAAHSALRAIIRLALPSAADWPNATLDAWIGEATRLYSDSFPRRLRYTLTLTTGTQAYSLPGGHDLVRVLSVEYPTGQSPQSFLREVLERDDAFGLQSDVYAIRPVADTVVAASDTVAAQIVFAESVTTGEYAAIDYLTTHRVATADSDIVTIPANHWEGIVAFCRFRAYVELEADESVLVDTSNISIVLAQLGQAGRAAWRAYNQVMDRLRDSTPSPSEAVSWHNVAGSGRIY